MKEQELMNLIAVKDETIKKLLRKVEVLTMKIEPYDFSPLGQKFRTDDYKCKIVINIDRKVNKDTYRAFLFDIVYTDSYYGEPSYCFDIDKSTYTDTDNGTEIVCSLFTNKSKHQRSHNDLELDQFLSTEDGDLEYTIHMAAKDRRPHEIDNNAHVEAKGFITLKDEDGNECEERVVNIIVE